jgi:hypothetical protein
VLIAKSESFSKNYKSHKFKRETEDSIPYTTLLKI